MKWLLKYQKLRFPMRLFVPFALGLGIFTVNPVEQLVHWFTASALWLVSLWVWRVIEDVGSWQIDRVTHPNRTYLFGKVFTYFTAISISFSALYTVVGTFVFENGWALLIYTALSVLVYWKRPLDKNLIDVIAWLKYPLLLVMISSLFTSCPSWNLPVGVTLLMIAYDKLESNKNTFIGALAYLLPTYFLWVYEGRDFVWILWMAHGILGAILYKNPKSNRWLWVLTIIEFFTVKYVLI